MLDFDEEFYAVNRNATGEISSIDQLVGRLRRVHTDTTFDWAQFRQMAQYGPGVQYFEEITDQQWCLIESVVAMHEFHLEDEAEARKRQVVSCHNYSA